MGQVFGILAKSNGVLVVDSPIYAEEESYYSLANIFPHSEKYVNKILTKTNFEQNKKDLLQLTQEEIQSLKYNNIEDYADTEIEYKKSINEPLSKDFYAIGIEYHNERGENVYSPKYESLENWSNTNSMLTALNKMKEVLSEDLNLKIASGEDDYVEDIEYSLDNIRFLFNEIEYLQKTQNVDKVALVYAPH